MRTAADATKQHIISELNTISILGTGWLGLPLTRHFITSGYSVNASTTSEHRLEELAATGAAPFIMNIDSLTSDIQDFLRAHTLIINIPSKNVAGFRQLAAEIDASSVRNVLFTSSTSVYRNLRATISEADTAYYTQSPLLEIEELLHQGKKTRTTIIRFGGLIGYSRHPGRFFRSGKIVPNPDTPVNLIHRDDCIGIINEVIEQQLWGNVFNCCADTHPTKREFYSRAAATLGAKHPVFGETIPTAGKKIDNEKVKRLLNYDFIHPDLMTIDFTENR